MNEHFSFKRFIFSLLIGLGGAVTAVFAPILTIPVVCAIAFLGIGRGLSYAAVAFVFTAGGIVVANAGNTLMLAALLFMLAFMTAVLIGGFKKKLPYRTIALILAAGFLIGLYAMYSVPSLSEGKAPYAGLVESFKQLSSYYEQGYVPEDLELMIANLPETFYGTLILFAEALAFICVILTKRFCSLFNAEVRAMAPFREWQLPPSLKIGLPVLVAAIVMSYIVGFNGASTITYTVAYMLLPLFFVAGLCFIRFFFSRSGRIPGVIGWLFLAFIVLSPMLSVMFGLLDLYTGLRKKMIRVDRLIKAAFEDAEREHKDVVEVDFGDGRGKQIIARRKDSASAAFFDPQSSAPAAEDEKTESADNDTKNDGSDAPTDDGSNENND